MRKYISSEKLYEALYKEAFEGSSPDKKWNASGCWIRFNLFENVLDKQSAEDVRPDVRGRWVPNGENTYTCSECGKGIYADRRELLPNFCENCGARMFSKNKIPQIESLDRLKAYKSALCNISADILKVAHEIDMEINEGKEEEDGRKKTEV